MRNEKGSFSGGNYSVGAIHTVDFYCNGTAIVNRYPVGKPPDDPPVRGGIKYLSRQSLNKLAFVSQETEVRLQSMITLTYGINWPRSGKAIKGHLNAFLVMAKRRGIIKDYIWFLEFQRRGAPHFHILSSEERGPADLASELAMEWALICTNRSYTPYSDIVSRETIVPRTRVYNVHSHKKTWENVRSADGARKYIIKYASKPKQKIVPVYFSDVGRFWGASRKVKTSIREHTEVKMGDGELREFLEKTGHPVRAWDILPKYIFGAYSRREEVDNN